MGQQILNGIFVGSIYALFAVGYTLVFGVLDILNLAHQAVFMLSAFIALALVENAHLSIWLALPLAIIAGGLMGIVLERLAFRPLRGRAGSNISGLISSLAMATVFQALALQIWGPNVSRFPVGTVPERPIAFLGGVISSLQILIIGIALGLFVALAVLVRRTRLGRQMRAVAESPRAARIVGVNVDRVIVASFFMRIVLSRD